MVSYTCVRDGSRGRANTFEGVLDKSLLVFIYVFLLSYAVVRNRVGESKFTHIKIRLFLVRKRRCKKKTLK